MLVFTNIVRETLGDTMPRPGRKMLTVEIPIQLHDELKMISVKHRCTLTKIIIRYLVEKVLEEKKRNETDNDLDNNDNILSDLGSRS
jgi:hypothetical protein